MKYYNLLKFSIFALFVQSMFIWVTWSIPIGLFHILVLYVFYLFYHDNRIRFILKHKEIAVLLGVVLTYQCIKAEVEITTWVSNILLYFIFLLVLGLPRQIYNDTIQCVTKWMAIILVPSLIVHVLIMITGVQSPFLLDSYKDSYGTFQNYFVYIHLVSEVVFRFNGPFLEPGHLGMIISFLLFANNYEVKRWHVAFLLACLIFTISIAGYILCFGGWVLLYFMKMKRIFSGIVLLIIMIAGLSSVPKDSVFYELTIARLEFEDGVMVGDNRITMDGDYYYQQLIKSGEWLFGYGNTLKDDRVKGAGLKIYVLRNGFLGVILWGLIFLIMAIKSPNKTYALLFFLVCCLSLYQRFYPYWFSWFFTYCAAINMYHLKPRSINNKKK